MIRRIGLTKRRIALIVGAWLLVIAVSLAVTVLQLRIGNLRELREAFARWRTPGEGRTVVVFAPHCDDETVAVGGLIRQAVQNGANVWVVLMTNGDGFRAAAMLETHSLRLRPKAFVEFGYIRQRESFAALRRLGVPLDHVITLGYPDRGLEAMWISNWATPYISPYTRDDHSPYDDSYTRGAMYTGGQLLADLKKVLRRLHPDDIYMPHPNDQHPDHWATSAFVTAALYDLGWLPAKNVALYLVHRGDWPVPQGLHMGAKLAPPAKLDGLDTDWRQFPLEESTVQAKRLAVQGFRSQTAGAQRFIRSFVRQNELFGTREAEARLPECESMEVDGKIEDWQDIEPVILDPADDGIPAHARPAADLTRIYAARNRGRLYFRISLRGQPKKGTIYELAVHPLADAEGATSSVRFGLGRRPPSGWSVAFGRRDIELSCSIKRWQGRPLLVAAGTKANFYHIALNRIDRSAYRILVP